MQKMRILNRFGHWDFIPWSFDPAVNTEWANKARAILEREGIAAQVTEVAPSVFWYDTGAERHCHLWDGMTAEDVRPHCGA